MTRLVLVLAIALGFLALPVTPPVGPFPFPDKTKARIVISQDKQRMFIYEGKTAVRELPISTGWPGVRKTSTPAWSGRIGEYWGTFSSFGTTQDLGYWLFTDYLTDESWNGDILLHGAPYAVAPDGQKLYSTEQIGFAPASHGCIQMFPSDAEWFHQWNPVGVPLIIESFSGGTLAYPRIVFGAQLAGLTTTQGQVDPAKTGLVSAP